MRLNTRPFFLKGKVQMGPAGFEPATSRLCVPLQLSLPHVSLWAGLSLHPSGMPAVKSLHLPLRGLGSGLPAKASPNLTGKHLKIASQAALLSRML